MEKSTSITDLVEKYIGCLILFQHLSFVPEHLFQQKIVCKMSSRKRPSRRGAGKRISVQVNDSESASPLRERGSFGPRATSSGQGPERQGPAIPNRTRGRKGSPRGRGPARGRGAPRGRGRGTARGNAPARPKGQQGWRRSLRLQNRAAKGMQSQHIAEAGPPTAPSRLESLPPELLMSVTDLLRPSDIVCLSLCSHYLFNSIDTHWLLGNKAINVAALTQIAGGLPDQYCCHYCAKLHKTVLVFPPGSWITGGDWCRGSLANGFREETFEPLGHLFEAHCAPTRYNFRLNHLLIAMKHYYRGTTTRVTVPSLCYTEVLNWRHDRFVTTLLSVDAYPCILDRGHRTLILQIQQWVVYRGNREAIGQLGITVDVGRLAICAHKFLSSNDVRQYMVHTLNRKGWRRDPTPRGLRCCPTCWVDFTIELRQLETNTKAIVVTKWVDLGAGLELNDPKWHLITNKQIRTAAAGPIMRSPGRALRTLDAADPRMGVPAPLSTLTAYNQSFLEGDRYMNYLRPGTNGFFSWSGEYHARNPEDLILRVVP